jgi:predicted membrane-bound spermidine synthase
MPGVRGCLLAFLAALTGILAGVWLVLPRIGILWGAILFGMCSLAILLLFTARTGDLIVKAGLEDEKVYRFALQKGAICLICAVGELVDEETSREPSTTVVAHPKVRLFGAGSTR